MDKTRIGALKEELLPNNLQALAKNPLLTLAIEKSEVECLHSREQASNPLCLVREKAIPLPEKPTLLSPRNEHRWATICSAQCPYHRLPKTPPF
jgi:hypothetical protein